MTQIVIALIATLIVFLIYGAVMMIKEKRDGEKEIYVCTQCGEKDCICHKTERE